MPGAWSVTSSWALRRRTMRVRARCRLSARARVRPRGEARRRDGRRRPGVTRRGIGVPACCRRRGGDQATRGVAAHPALAPAHPGAGQQLDGAASPAPSSATAVADRADGAPPRSGTRRCRRVASRVQPRADRVGTCIAAAKPAQPRRGAAAGAGCAAAAAPPGGGGGRGRPAMRALGAAPGRRRRRRWPRPRRSTPGDARCAARRRRARPRRRRRGRGRAAELHGELELGGERRSRRRAVSHGDVALGPGPHAPVAVEPRRRSRPRAGRRRAPRPRPGRVRERDPVPGEQRRRTRRLRRPCPALRQLPRRSRAHSRGRRRPRTTSATSAPGRGEARRDRQQERAGPGDHDPAAREHAAALEQRLRAARGDDAGQVPAGEGQHPVVRAGRQHDARRAATSSGPPARGRRPGACTPGRPDAGVDAPDAWSAAGARPRRESCSSASLRARNAARSWCSARGRSGVPRPSGVPPVLAARPCSPVEQDDPGAGAGPPPRRRPAPPGPRRRPATSARSGRHGPLPSCVRDRDRPARAGTRQARWSGRPLTVDQAVEADADAAEEPARAAADRGCVRQERDARAQSAARDGLAGRPTRDGRRRRTTNAGRCRRHQGTCSHRHLRVEPVGPERREVAARAPRRSAPARSGAPVPAARPMPAPSWPQAWQQPRAPAGRGRSPAGGRGSTGRKPRTRGCADVAPARGTAATACAASRRTHRAARTSRSKPTRSRLAPMSTVPPRVPSTTGESPAPAESLATSAT